LRFRFVHVWDDAGRTARKHFAYDGSPERASTAGHHNLFARKIHR
jgi:hypothetical protein